MITLQKQFKDDACVAACIAMVSNCHQESIYHDLDDESDLKSEFMQWVRLGYLPTLHSFTHLIFDKVQIVTVPSLNVVGGNHRIVVTNDDENGWQVFDPQNGVKDKKFYANIESLKSWTQLTTVEYCRFKSDLKI